MSKIFKQMENAIKAGDWVEICNVYKKITGQSIDPPKVGPPPFDWKTAKKAELYKELTKVVPDILAAKEYTTEDLRILAKLHFDDEEEDSNDFEFTDLTPSTPATQGSSNIDYTYIPEGKVPLNMDKQKLRPIFKDFPTYNDEKNPVARTREQQATFSAKCIKCNRIYDNIHPSLITKGAISGEKIFCCANCGDSIRR